MQKAVIAINCVFLRMEQEAACGVTHVGGNMSARLDGYAGFGAPQMQPTRCIAENGVHS